MNVFKPGSHTYPRMRRSAAALPSRYCGCGGEHFLSALDSVTYGAASELYAYWVKQRALKDTSFSCDAYVSWRVANP